MIIATISKEHGRVNTCQNIRQQIKLLLAAVDYVRGYPM